MAVLRKINSTTELFYEEGGWVGRGGILLLRVFIFVKKYLFLTLILIVKKRITRHLI